MNRLWLALRLHCPQNVNLEALFNGTTTVCFPALLTHAETLWNNLKQSAGESSVFRCGYLL